MKESFFDRLYRVLMTINPMLTALVLIVVVFLGSYVADHYHWLETST